MQFCDDDDSNRMFRLICLIFIQYMAASDANKGRGSGVWVADWHRWDDMKTNSKINKRETNMTMLRCRCCVPLTWIHSNGSSPNIATPYTQSRSLSLSSTTPYTHRQLAPIQSVLACHPYKRKAALDWRYYTTRSVSISSIYLFYDLMSQRMSSHWHAIYPANSTYTHLGSTTGYG